MPKQEVSSILENLSEEEVKQLAGLLAKMGRNGDTLLAHITPEEAQMLRDMGGAGTRNPDTGLPEFYDADDSGNAADPGNPTGGDTGSPSGDSSGDGGSSSQDSGAGNGGDSNPDSPGTPSAAAVPGPPTPEAREAAFAVPGGGGGIDRLSRRAGARNTRAALRAGLTIAGASGLTIPR